jgi:ketosteroid isomerase-like protein
MSYAAAGRLRTGHPGSAAPADVVRRFDQFPKEEKAFAFGRVASHSGSIHAPCVSRRGAFSAAEIMDSDNRNDAFIPYPTDRVVGTIEEAKDVRRAIDALSEAGFPRDEIDVLHGDDALNRLDPTGAEHGFWARFQRTLIRTAGPVEEYKHLTRHIEDIRAGRFVVMVLAKQASRRRTAAEILSSHGAEFIGFYGRWAYQGFDADRIAPAQARAGAASAESSDAGAHGNDAADTVKRMFAAFRAGDLDGLLATVHPDSHWTYIGANPQQSRAEFTGPAQVRSFFERIVGRLEITAFNTDQFVVEGDTVVVFGSESGTVKATQEPFRNEWSQKYVVKDGMIVEMAEYNIQVEPRR